MSLFSNAIAQRKLPERSPNLSYNDPALYLPSKGLWNAVGVALEMNLPLLLTGEPGTGKTQLAHYIAWYFGLEKPLIFDAQTNSNVRDLFYHYDALGHFQYAQTQKNALTLHEVEDRFISYQALGQAIRMDSRDKPFVVLIDEIDKTPRDLPNNILAALEEMRFLVPEINKSYRAESRHFPIVIMTSNSEKNLPDAFLRRVAYYHIPFPDGDQLLEILQSKIPQFIFGEPKFLIDHFEMIRGNRQISWHKKPATAELLYWAAFLQKAGFPAESLNDLDRLSSDQKALLETSYSILAKSKEDYEVLKKLLG